MESLILRRNYPVPVTFADLRRAHESVSVASHFSLNCWHAALKEATGAKDDVYAIVDGHELHIGSVRPSEGVLYTFATRALRASLNHLLEVADEQGYWERPHEVRVDLQERITSKRAIDEVVQRSLIEAEVRRGH